MLDHKHRFPKLRPNSLEVQLSVKNSFAIFKSNETIKFVSSNIYEFGIDSELCVCNSAFLISLNMKHQITHSQIL